MGAPEIISLQILQIKSTLGIDSHLLQVINLENDKSPKMDFGLVGGLGTPDSIDLFTVSQKSTPYFISGYCISIICFHHKSGWRYYQ
jgi:hypothetical protein